MIRKGKLIAAYTPEAKVEGAQTPLPFLRYFRLTRLFREIRKAKQFSAPNTDSCSALGAELLVEEIAGDAGQTVVRSSNDKVEKIAQPGETRLYSTADGETVVAFVFLKKNGNIILEGNELQLNGTEFEGLVKIADLTTKLNDLVTEVRAHTHGVIPASGSTFTNFVQAEYENTEVKHG